jgi:hypothetical protein
MTNSPAMTTPRHESPWDVPKVRQCLRCRATFPSNWCGERICARCKSSNAWRNGRLPGVSSSSNGR